MKRSVVFLMTLAYVCALAGCGKRPPQPAPSPLPSEVVTATPSPTPEPSPTPPTVDVTLTYDPEELEPWQVAYIQFLEGKLEQEDGRFTEEFLYEWPYYYLYDIDKNGVPELIVLYGGRYDGVIYTYDRGEVKALNENEQKDMLYIKNGGLYTWPEGNGVLYVSSFLWDIDCTLYYIEDGQLKWKDVEDPEPEVYEDGHIEEYPTLQDRYPDSQYVDGYCALVAAPERGINFLPIINYDPPEADFPSNEQAKQEGQRVKDVIDNNGWFYYVPSLYEGDKAGWTTLKERCQERSTTVSDVKWKDLNGDGVMDATLRFSNGDGLILSSQDGVEYGYALVYSLDDYAWTSKGRFVSTDPSRPFPNCQVYFAKNQSYTTYARRENIFPREFWHTIGAGGWSTEMNVEKDGTFEGNYNWHRIAAEGEDCEMYSCNFSGKFSEPKQVNEYTYSVQLEKLNIEPGWLGVESDEGNLTETETEGEVPGLEGGEEFLIYLPGAPLEELPEEFLYWSLLMVDRDDTVLPSYGLYNVNTQIGWFDWSGW